MLSFIKNIFRSSEVDNDEDMINNKNFNWFDIVIFCHNNIEYKSKMSRYIKILWKRDYPDETYQSKNIYLNRQKFNILEWWRIGCSDYNKFPILIKGKLLKIVLKNRKSLFNLITLKNYHSILGGKDVLVLLDDEDRYKDTKAKLEAFFHTGDYVPI